MQNIIFNAKTAKYVRGWAQIVAFITISTGLHSCSKINDTTEMNIAFEPAAFAYEMPVVSNVTSATNLGSIPISFDVDSIIKLQNQRFSSADIKSIKLSSFVLVLTDNVEAENNFANIENINVTLRSAGQTSNILASTTVPDALSGSIRLPTTATVNDLKTYIPGSAATFILTGKLRRATTKILKAKATATFQVQLEL